MKEGRRGREGGGGAARGVWGGPLKLAPSYGLHPISLKLHSLQMWRLAYRQTMLCSIATIKINLAAKKRGREEGWGRGGGMEGGGRKADMEHQRQIEMCSQ